ncbi:MAG TPA: class I SAM-dependent methyltransferase [Candidatus Binataceae bacterium]|jgi:SAM-dependent methyltransferase|nr:class I SAM-dependent methyltransferase [Candidatus Binataceae bacterium]
MKEHSIYEFPDLFRVVHMEKPGDIGEEVEFLKRVWERHSRRPIRRVLDIACGNSPHGQLLAAQGIAMVGIDRSPAMIATGRREGRGLDNLTFVRRRIERFRLPRGGFDAAFFMSETLPVIVENTDLISHLRSVAAALRKDGLYCVDIDRHDDIEGAHRRRLWRRRKVRHGGVSIAIAEFLRPIAWHASAWIYELECTIRFPDRTVKTRDLVPVRYTVPKLMDLAARASGVFRLIAVYSDLSFETPLDQCERRWWGVLRRL